MIYPVAVIIDRRRSSSSIILWKVIPTFAALFAGLGAELPLPTRVVIAASNFLARYFVVHRDRRSCCVRRRLPAATTRPTAAGASSTGCC